MVKRFYQSVISLKFSFFLTALSIAVFAVAFLWVNSNNENYKYALIALACVLAIALIFYYKQKFTVSKTLRSIQNIKEYENAGMLERSFILEDRMLIGYKNVIEEHPTNTIKKVSYLDEGKRGVLEIQSEEGNYKAQVISKDEAERFCAFIKRKNPEVQLENIEVKGNGTLKELGA